MPKLPVDEWDKQIGLRIRLRRSEIGLSQTKLAARIGVTYQAVQKMEEGRSRIPAARLEAIACELEVSLQFLLKGPEAEVPENDDATLFAATPEGKSFYHALARITDPNIRRHVLTFIVNHGKELSAHSKLRPDAPDEPSGEDFHRVPVRPKKSGK